MPFPLHLFNPQQFPRLTPRRVTLVRFVRAVQGFASESATDPDDRGFNLDPIYANARGPAFGIPGPDGAAPARECQIQVMRDRLEPAVQLFPEIVDTGLVSLVAPAAGVPLPASGIITVRAARSPVSGTSTTLRLHAGAAAGPVVGECTVRVCPMINIPAKGHRVNIGGTPPNSNEAVFQSLLANANKILIVAGIKVTLEPGIEEDPVHTDLRTAGTVTLLNTNPWDDELAKVMRRHSVPGVLNIYMVAHIDRILATGLEHDNVRGVGISSAFVAANPPSGTYVGAQTGFLLRDPDDLEGFGATFAHELGHVLTLEHYNNKNGDEVQRNNWSQRNLMFNNSNLSSGAPVDQIGYGNHSAAAGGGVRRGMFIGIKQLARIAQSQQSDIMRAAALDGSYLPT